MSRMDTMIGKWTAGDRVIVRHDNLPELPGRISAVVPTRQDGRSIKVIFDDPLVYGGMGAGWFFPYQLVHVPART